LEILKYVNGRGLDQYRDNFINLALPLFTMSEPLPPTKIKTRTVLEYPDPINHPTYTEVNHKKNK